ncbi:ATP synthase subunit f, mitochondrial-like [Symphalangus syndactylus]|uniref:ATP synthase subunit f, mitochondrial-like n=1 Tax=Symphalangus syndactylus TaxID=9590 RepID=UPI0024430DDC|nr:ATP synthase subunit f, mitochondrial-like [Symphalangus syndactylus]
MASVIPVKDKKLLEVKWVELPSWILTRDFSPSGIFGAFRRSYYRYYNKYINVKKRSISGVTMVLACYVLFSYCLPYKQLKHERLCKYYLRGHARRPPTPRPSWPEPLREEHNLDRC